MSRPFIRRIGLALLWAGMSYAPLAQGEDAKARAAAHYRAGSQAYVERRFETTIEELRKSLALDPKQLGAVRLLGLTYQLTDRLDLAREQFENACRLSPKDAETWFYLGRVHYLQNFFDKAFEALTTAAKYAPENARVRESLGLTLEAMGDTAGAEREYQHAIRSLKAGSSPTPYLSYGAFLLKQSRIADSERMLARAVEALPTNWQSHFELAKLYVQTDRFEAALKELQAALACERRDDESRRTQGLLAIVYSRLGRDAEARSAAAAAEP